METRQGALVYEIVDGKNGFEIQEKSLETLAEKWREETTTPKGVGPEVYVWGTQVRSWGVGGNHDHLLVELDTEADAEDYLFDIRLVELNKSQANWFYSRSEAEEQLAEILAD